MNFKKLFSLFAITLSAFGLFGASKASAMRSDNKPNVKAVMLGNCGTGKTCLLNVLAGREFGEMYVPSFGGEMISLDYYNHRDSRSVTVWDTAGQEAFMGLTSNYVRDADIILAVFSHNDKISYDNLNTWVNFAKDVCSVEYSENNLPKLIIVGTKNDLEKSFDVDEKALKNMFADFDLLYISTSAMNCDGVDCLKENLVQLGSKINSAKKNMQKNIKLNANPKKNNCC